MGLCLIKICFYWIDPIKIQGGVMNFICFLSSDAVVSGGVVLVEWFIDFFTIVCSQVCSSRKSWR